MNYVDLAAFRYFRMDEEGEEALRVGDGQYLYWLPGKPRLPR